MVGLLTGESMKLVFFGTGKFGLPTIKKLIASDHEVLAVVTQPDKKKGRGHNFKPTSVKALVGQIAPATDVFQPEKVSSKEFVETLKSMGVEIFVVVDYGQLLSKEVLMAPSKYCINLHPSLLPKYRGASPLNHVILNGDPETGNTVIKMNERMDAGSIIMQSKMDIGVEEDAESLGNRLSGQGADLVLKALDEIEAGAEHFTKQDEEEATYAHKLKKEDGLIDWETSAVDIVRKIRALKPWPGAFTLLEGKQLKVIEAEIVDAPEENIAAGTIFDYKQFIVKAGQGAIRIDMLQLEGKKAMSTEEFLRGHALDGNIIMGTQS